MSLAGSKWRYRVGWFVALWAASVLTLAVVALIFRAIMTAAGLTSG